LVADSIHDLRKLKLGTYLSVMLTIYCHGHDVDRKFDINPLLSGWFMR
jgi:hypothetical protein